MMPPSTKGAPVGAMIAATSATRAGLMALHSTKTGFCALAAKTRREAARERRASPGGMTESMKSAAADQPRIVVDGFHPGGWRARGARRAAAGERGQHARAVLVQAPADAGAHLALRDHHHRRRHSRLLLSDAQG